MAAKAALTIQLLDIEDRQAQAAKRVARAWGPTSRANASNDYSEFHSLP